MAENSDQPLRRNRRWPQFSLRSMLAVVTGVALLLSQCPFFEVVPYSGELQGTTVNFYRPITEIVAPTKGFVLVMIGEITVIITWLAFRDLRVHRARGADQQVTRH